MKRIYYYFSTLLLSGLLAGACTEETEQSGDGNATGVPVKHEISIATMPIESVVAAPATRSVAATDEMVEMSVGAASTRATTEKNEDESKIHSLYIVQFEGTTTTSKLLKISGDLRAELEANGKIDYEFATNGVVQRVYVVANMDISGYTVGSTMLAVFEASVVSFSPVTSVPDGGLPMAGSQDFNPLTDAPGTYALKTPLTKLTFGVDFVAGVTTTSDLKIVLKNLPNGYCMKQATLSPSESSQQSGMTYTGTLDLIASKTSPVTYYLPANLAGRNTGLESVTHRNSFFTPKNAMFVEITGTIKGQANTRFYLALGDGTAQDFNMAPNSAYTITTTIKGINEAADLRVGGDITDLNAQLGGKTANCYVVTESNKRFAFNATVMGNGATIPAHTKLGNMGILDADFPAITPEPLDPHSGSILWQTNNATAFDGNVVSSAIVVDGKMVIKTTEKTGNAVVVAYNSNDVSGDIIWSWHIWRPESTPMEKPLATITDGASLSVSDLVLMDRNLGALNATAQDNGSKGLLYQWGRKDPFPSLSEFGAYSVMATSIAALNPVLFPFPIAKGGASITPTDAVKAPHTFFSATSGDDSAEWTLRNDNLWGTPLGGISTIKYGVNNGLTLKINTNKGSKSMYDPCPVGWRVAPAYTFVNAYSIAKPTFSNGIAYAIGQSGSEIWFPASAMLSGGSTLTNHMYGQYWTSSPSVTTSSIRTVFLFTNSGVGMNFTYEESTCGKSSYANAVRCAKE